MPRDNGIVFVVGVSLEDLEKPLPHGLTYLTTTTGQNIKNLFGADVMMHIDVEVYTDFYKKNKSLKFNGMYWNMNQFENYSNIGEYLVYISKDKNKAIDKIVDIYRSFPSTRAKKLEGGYFND